MLLLEAGGRDLNPLIHIPIGLGMLHEYGMHDWGYESEPEPNLNGRRLNEQRGKVLGGSSSINVMAFTRGDPGDYDRWAQKGALGWSYADVLPYFKRVESWQDGDSDRRGGDGPIGVQWAKTQDPLYDAWIEAARAAGYPVTDDYNGVSGGGLRPRPILDPQRPPLLGRGRLSAARAEAEKSRRSRCARTPRASLLQGTRAIGVEYVKARPDAARQRAAREVILSGGAFNTPQLLMLSGIGPAEHLREIGIAPVLDLPVGKNLQDHLAVLIMFSRAGRGRVPRQHAVRPHGDEHDPRLSLRHRSGDRRAGRHARLHQDAAGARRARHRVHVPRRAARGASLVSRREGGLSRRLRHPAVPAASGQPRRGAAALGRSARPGAHPSELLLGAERSAEAARGLQARARGGAAEAARSLSRRGDSIPATGVQTDAEIDAWIRKVAATANHPASTCTMGTSPGTVLDPQLRVRGAERLRVVDASAMPDLVSAHINACVLMMAEKACRHDPRQAPARVGAA